MAAVTRSKTRWRKTLLRIFAGLLLLMGAVHAEQKPALALVVEGVQGDQLANVLAYLQIARAAQPVQDAFVLKWLRDKFAWFPQAPESVTYYTLPFGEPRLRWLHGKAAEDIRQALQPFGYYQPTVRGTLEHTDQTWVAHYHIDRGPPIRIGRLDIRVLGDGEEDPEFQRLLRQLPLAEGGILFQPAYEALKKQLQRTAANRGYFDAKLQTHRIAIDLQAQRAEVTLVFETGRRYRFGDIDLPTVALAPQFLRRYVQLHQLHPGDPYDSEALLRLQSDLINSNYFNRVEVRAPPEQAVDEQVPVIVDLELQPGRELSFGLGYTTDTGPQAKIGLEYRHLNRYGHRLRSEAQASTIHYGMGMVYEIPGADPVNDLYTLQAVAYRENSDVKDTETVLIGGSWKKGFKVWERLLSLNYSIERFTTDDQQTSQLLVGAATFTRVSADDPLNTTRGSRLELKLQEAYQPLLSDISFLQPRLTGKLIWSFRQHSRLIGRADLGATAVSDFDQLPSSLRFFAGGDKSVRGYELDNIGPVNDAGDVVGGRYLVVASLEYEYRFLEKWGVAAFVDSGDAFDNTLDLKTGAGLGLRWYSPFGPIRLDLAHAFQNHPGSNFRIHLTIGPDL
jgi:translocation and assembly module TamA